MKDRTAVNSTYERDFAVWLEDQAAALRSGHWNDVDLPNLIGEIEALAGNLRRELRSRLSVVLVHLLKLRYQPEKRSGSWIASIYEQRDRLADLIEDSPSLRRVVESYIEHAYSRARRIAAAQTELSVDTFPERCPFAIAEVLETPLG